MITNKELNEVSLSPTKKDYYQIWNELIELADKLSDRWSPASTNESDPGIVLLKTLTAVADKLNYNIDKNTLEAFMPSATQEESMRKLTEMMGYSMKYYQAATCKATISYKATSDTDEQAFNNCGGIYFPAFVNLKNEDEDINYVTLSEFRLQEGSGSRQLDVMEGELLECEADNNNVITSLQLDDLNRYILPEVAIAENGVFVTNISESNESEMWKKVDNLNVCLPGSQVYKFGFDSKLKLPYIQFPSDISSIIHDGLKIKYIRTRGLEGNITAKYLSKLEKPTIWATSDNEFIKSLDSSSFVVTNTTAASNGANPESLNAAYNNYKKTIGTFDTLVTCRDYMNKIYQMTKSQTDTTPLVSNIIVSDIRDDINRATTLCSFNEYGICYNDVSFKDSNNNDQIDHFDLLLYPFKTIYGLNNKNEFVNSFKYTAENIPQIQAELKNYKTIAHEFNTPSSKGSNEDVVCIKNYLRLKAKISTTKKVTYLEEASILENIYTALFKNFNARQIDFGEEIPYDSLVQVIKTADYRIKDINLDEPVLCTKFCLASGDEEELVATEYSQQESTQQANKIYNKLALRNVLAGKIAAFQYSQNFITTFEEAKYDGKIPGTTNQKYSAEYPEASKQIVKLTSHFDTQTALGDDSTLTLAENQVIQFRLPNFKTIQTYPSYVNYYLSLNTIDGNSKNKKAIPATFMPLGEFMDTNNLWESFGNFEDISDRIDTANPITISDNAAFVTKIETEGVLFYQEGNAYKATNQYIPGITTYYKLPLNDTLFVKFNKWIKSLTINNIKLKGIYRSLGVQKTNTYGVLIDEDLIKYMEAYKFGIAVNNNEILLKYFVQATHAEDSVEVVGGYATKDGLGQNADNETLTKDGEYELKPNEYLLINYTDSKTDEAGKETKSVINKYYGPGTIIRPNFALTDSVLYHSSGHSYSKTSGFYFKETTTPEGMFTLGVNEQIEIRDIVKINFTSKDTLLYWILQSDDPEVETNTFNFDEDYGLDEDRKDSNGNEWIKDGKPIHNAYTLKEGEYLCYTTSKKQDLAYYGTGTLIVREINTKPLQKFARNGEISMEEIITNGNTAAIPWHGFNLSSPNSGLKVIENQYISLTESDKLLMLSNTDEESETGIINLTNDWIPVKAAKYQFAEDSADNIITYLPKVLVTGLNWTARSRLDFNMSQTVAQPLHKGDSINVEFSDKTSILLQSDLSTNKDNLLYINSNYTCQAGLDLISLEKIPNFKLKLSKKVSPTLADNSIVNLNNYINGDSYYTKFDFKNLPIISEDSQESNSDPAFSLNINLPSNTFGLVMFYYISNKPTTVTDDYVGAYIKAIDSSENYINLSAFNTSETPSEIYYLKEGINIIKLSVEATTLDIFADSLKTSSIIFSNIDIVEGINPKLDYRIINKGNNFNALDQLLYDIKSLGIADKFYYNVPINGADLIDLNPIVEDDLLSSPLSWYDTNNINNKFVISEIDADYLSSGITLTKSSRV